MTKKPSITPKQLAAYENLTLHEIEQAALKLRSAPDSEKDSLAYRIAHQALNSRKRRLKAVAATFESTNDHHLLFYDSTAGFTKMIGHSVLFFSMTIAERIHWRYTIKSDSDHYSVSEDGIISFRSLDRLTLLLSEINVLPDESLSTDELHYFILPKVYTEEQIESLRDSSRAELSRINSIVLPRSPLPSLYGAITDASSLIYSQFKHLSDPFAREVIGEDLVTTIYHLHNAYLSFADTKSTDAQKHLLEIIRLARHLRQGLAFASQLRLLHHRHICRILDQVVIIERIATGAYRKSKEKSS